MKESPFSSNFVLYRGELRIQHTVRTEESAEAHIAALEAYIVALESTGQAPTEEGLDTDEERYTICGYVVTKSSRDDLVLHLYTDHWDYPMKGGSVYEDHWEKLDFEPNCDKVYDGVGKMEKKVAMKKGYYIAHKGDVVIRNTHKLTDAGKEIWRFARSAGVTAAPAAPPAETPATEGDSTTLCDTICEYISSDQVGDLSKLRSAAAKAVGRKSQLEDCWPTVQSAIRLKLIHFLNLAKKKEQREDLRKITKEFDELGVLPNGYAVELTAEIDVLGNDDIPF